MSTIEKIADLVNRLGCRPRLKHRNYEEPEGWGMGIVLPVRGYIEITGPWPFREVEWIETNPLVTEHIGRLIAPKQWNHLEQIAALLQAEGVDYSIVDGMVRIPFGVFANR